MTSLVTVGGSVGGNAIEALFFSRQGTAALPALYMALGITNFVVSLGITAVLGRVARVRVYLALPLVLAASLALQRVVLAMDIPWTYAVFWLLMNVEGLLQGMLAWGVASIVCDTRQAKRLFPLFAAGGIFGGVVGGLLTRPLAGRLGTENPLAKAATRAYPSAEQLAGFFGLLGGASTGAAFLASLFVANRLFARVGIMTAILVFPLLYAAGFATLLVTQTAFSALVAFRFAQLVYLQGIASPAYESVFNVIPRERRDAVRAFLSGVPDQAGIVIAGAVLLIGDRTLDSGQLAVIGLGAALATAYIWWRASRQYARALVRTLRTGQPIVFTGEEEPFGGFRRDAGAVSAARAAARDPDPRTRLIGVEVLGQLAGEDHLLVAALDDADDDVRRAAANGLARQHAPMPRMFLDDVDPAVRATCAAALLEIEPRAWPTLDSMLHSGDAELRLVAVRGLGHSRVRAAAEAIMDLATDTDPRVRAAAVRALPAAGAAALPLLAAAIRDQDRAVRLAAADALVKVGTPALAVAMGAIEDGTAVDDALDAIRRIPAAAVAARVREVARRRAADARRYHGVARGLRGEDERTAFAR